MKLYVLTIFLLLCISCKQESDVEKQLIAALTIMDQNPEGGLKFINNVDTSAIKTEREKALYSLAYAEAFCKEFGYVETADILKPTLEFFSKRKDNDYFKMLAHFYSGLGHFNQEEYDRAVTEYMFASQLGEKINSKFHLGLIYRELAQTLTKVAIERQALVYSEKSFEAFKECGESVYLAEAYQDLAKIQNNNGRFNEALINCHHALDYARKHDYKELEAEAHYSEAIAYLNLNNYHEALRAYKDALSADSSYIDIRAKENMVRSLFLSGDKEGAESLFTELQRHDGTLVFKPVEMYESEGDYYNAYLAKKHEYANAERKFQKVFAQSVTKTIDEFNQRKARQEARRAGRYRAWVWGISCTAVVVICLISVIFILYRKTKRKERDERDATIGALHESLSDLQKEADTARAEYENVRKELKAGNPLQGVKDKFGYLNSLCSEYYSTDGPVKQKANRLAEKIQKEIDRMRDDKKFQKSIEAKFNAASGGLMTAMRADYPGLKEQDYMLVLYSGLGFTSKAVAVLLDSEAGALYTRRWRLAARIAEGKSERRDELLELIRM